MSSPVITTTGCCSYKYVN